jgi:hypothetical protein
MHVLIRVQLSLQIVQRRQAEHIVTKCQERSRGGGAGCAVDGYGQVGGTNRVHTGGNQVMFRAEQGQQFECVVLPPKTMCVAIVKRAACSAAAAAVAAATAQDMFACNQLPVHCYC